MSFANLFGSGGGVQIPLGEALIREGLINEKQLAQSVERQNQAQAKGRTLHLSRAIVEGGFASEKEVLALINKVYGLGASTLTEDIDEQIESAGEGLMGLRIPISVKLSLTLAVFLLTIMLVLSYFMLKRQADNLYRESVKSGKISLGYFTTEAKIPLVNDDTLRLNSLIKEVTQVEGLVYAVIAGRDGTIKAHTDLSQIGRPLKLSGKIGEVSTENNITYFKRRLLNDEQILNVTAPVEFKGKTLGEVHVGISLDFIQDRIGKEKVFIYVMTIIFFLIGMAVAGLLGTSFSRPISRLVVATKEISGGNYHHKINFRRKDEFDDLGKAFNYMSHELWLKSIMRESFGRYVSTTIRDLILADPESVWLKGTKSEATIMFSDVRGFTKYSESSDPAVIVENLNQFFDVAAKHIEAHGGYIDKFIGDEFLAVFGGLPNYVGDHAVNAVRAAWNMQLELAQKAINSDNPLLGRVGTSINTGEVVSGNIGSEVRMEYTVIGDTVNTASRLNALAGPCKTVLSESTYARVKDFVATQMLQPQMVKGKTKALQPYQIVKVHDEGEGPAPPPIPFKGEGIAPPPPPKAGPAVTAPAPPKAQPPTAAQQSDKPASGVAAPTPQAPKKPA
ncbi:MAG: HAMP domain-containing protein [Proteobacteria bacterium]|nr:HAMP domain-containing protein [Pseudomonadota bacterium]